MAKRFTLYSDAISSYQTARRPLLSGRTCTPQSPNGNKVIEERRMLNANHAALRDSFATQQFDFIFVEIELGLTFCQAARTAGRKEVKQRNIKNAKTALATALKTITRGNISDQEAGILKPPYGSTKS